MLSYRGGDQDEYLTPKLAIKEREKIDTKIDKVEDEKAARVIGKFILLKIIDIRFELIVERWSMKGIVFSDQILVRNYSIEFNLLRSYLKSDKLPRRPCFIFHGLRHF